MISGRSTSILSGRVENDFRSMEPETPSLGHVNCNDPKEPHVARPIRSDA